MRDCQDACFGVMLALPIHASNSITSIVAISSSIQASVSLSFYFSLDSVCLWGNVFQPFCLGALTLIKDGPLPMRQNRILFLDNKLQKKKPAKRNHGAPTQRANATVIHAIPTLLTNDSLNSQNSEALLSPSWPW